MDKKAQINSLKMIDNDKYYTKQELDSINYFNRKGFYKQKQHLDNKSSIYDTRDSFLLKMCNSKLRREFLDNYNNIK